MSNNPAIGTLDCPICKAAGKTTEATVHRESNGRTKALYFRCPECGTIQPRKKPGGQENMQVLAKLYQPGQEQDDAVEAAAIEAADETKAAIRSARTKQRQETKPKPEAQPSALGGMLNRAATRLFTDTEV